MQFQFSDHSVVVGGVGGSPPAEEVRLKFDVDLGPFLFQQMSHLHWMLGWTD